MYPFYVNPYQASMQAFLSSRVNVTQEKSGIVFRFYPAESQDMSLLKEYFESVVRRSSSGNPLMMYVRGVPFMMGSLGYRAEYGENAQVERESSLEDNIYYI